MANCKLYLDLISELVDGELSPAQDSELRAHINQCESCKKVYSAFLDISQTLGENLVEPPEMLAKGIMFKINMQAAGGSKRRFAFGRFTAIAACLVLVMFGASRMGLFNTITSQGEPAEADVPSEMRSIGEDHPLPDVSPVIIDPSTFVSPSPDLFGVDIPPSPPQTPPTTGQTPPPEDGTVTQFGATFEEIILNTASNNLSPAPYISQLLLAAKEIEVYSGNYHYEIDKSTDKVTENKFMFKLFNKETLTTLTDILKAVEEESTISVMKPVAELKNEESVYSLIIPNASENIETPTSLRITIYLHEEKLWCRISEHLKDGKIKGEPLLFESAGTLEDLEKFLALQKPRINNFIN